MSLYANLESSIELKLRCHWWWQPLFYVCKPNVVIDNTSYSLRWGNHNLNLEPGHHDISISIPYLGMKDCGKAAADFDLLSGERIRIAYWPPFSIMQRGKIRIEPTLPAE